MRKIKGKNMSKEEQFKIELKALLEKHNASINVTSEIGDVEIQFSFDLLNVSYDNPIREGYNCSLSADDLDTVEGI